jgi:dimeric dUTPase (all-alpha-NTP-PPase superfamily)
MMDLTKLYETQKILRDRINYNEPDRLNKLILALLVELGECANEWRGFKFWSKNQEPRLEVKCHACDGTGYFYTGYDKEECMYCGCSGSEGKPLLEEYVDGLHFVLELGIELGITPIVCDLYIKTSDINEQFIEIFRIAAEIKAWKKKGDYSN